MRRIAITLAILLTVVAVVSVASACKIPVFRYALERWDPDSYVVEVVHHTNDLATIKPLLNQLQTAVDDQQQPVNLAISTVNLDHLDSAGVFYVKQYDNHAGPSLVVSYPGGGGGRGLAWSGPLTDANINALITSPARETIAENLLAGDSAVWVLIESGDKTKDDAAEKTLRAELKKQAAEIKLPTKEELKAEALYQEDQTVELRVGFSLVRIARDDPAEAIFASMLIHSEEGLDKEKEPIAIPIFGRGRTYFALLGQGINADTIAANSQFVCGDCSCEVKWQNPGSDLVFQVNWDKFVVGSVADDHPLPELTGLGGLIVETDIDEYGTEPQSSDAKQLTTPVRVASAANAGSASQSNPPETQTPAEDKSSTALAAAITPAAPAEINSDGGLSIVLLATVLGVVLLGAVVAVASATWMKSRAEG